MPTLRSFISGSDLRHLPQPERNIGLICVVADSRDLLALERTREFSGSYHVLGGLISPMDGIGPEALGIQPLLQRLDPENIEEVILALTQRGGRHHQPVSGTPAETLLPGDPHRLWLTGGQ